MAIPPGSSDSRSQRLKRAEVGLLVVVGLLMGGFVGFYLGSSFSDDASTAPGAETRGPVGRVVAGTAASERAAVAEAPDGEPSAGPTVHDWMTRTAAMFQNAPEGQMTPGLKEALADAMQPRELAADEARLLLVVEMMRKEDFPLAVEMFRNAKTSTFFNSSGGTGPLVWTALWRRFGELDPENALATALKHRDIRYEDREYLEKYLFAGMARKDPAAAADAFAAHPDLPNRHTAAQGLMREWTKSDPQAASAWALKNLSGQALGTAFYGAVLGLGKNDDISKVTAYVQTVPEGLPRTEALLSAKGVIGRSQSVPARQLLDFVTTTRALGARDRQFESQMAKRSAREDPVLAAEFFAAPLPDGKPNDYRELRTVLQSWLKQDAKAVESWAKGQEGKAHYEVVVSEMAGGEKADAVGR